LGDGPWNDPRCEAGEPIKVWASRWQDLSDFEIVPVLTSQQFWVELDKTT